MAKYIELYIYTLYSHQLPIDLVVPIIGPTKCSSRMAQEASNLQQIRGLFQAGTTWRNYKGKHIQNPANDVYIYILHAVKY